MHRPISDLKSDLAANPAEWRSPPRRSVTTPESAVTKPECGLGGDLGLLIRVVGLQLFFRPFLPTLRRNGR
jgi:hypothetical protein